MNDELEVQLEQLTSTAGDVAIDTGEGVTEYRRAGQLFAVRDEPGTIELRLRPDVAEAARRTPATAASARGDEWIRFSPPTWEQHSSDRLEAWFRVAWRAAASQK